MSQANRRKSTKFNGLDLSMLWIEWHIRRFWLGVLYTSLIRHLILCLEEFFLIQGYVSEIFTFIIFIFLNHFYLGFFYNFACRPYKNAGDYFIKNRLIFLLGALSSTLFVSSHYEIEIILTIMYFDCAFITLFYISNINRYICNFLFDQTQKPIPSYKSFLYRLFLYIRIQLSKMWQIVYSFISYPVKIALAVILVPIVRWIRIFIFKEGKVIQCNRLFDNKKKCRHFFEDPSLHCGYEKCTPLIVHTWPNYLNPLFTVCECGSIYPTWEPVKKAIKETRLNFRYLDCEYGTRCKNLGVDREDKTNYYKILFVCYDGESAATALLSITEWIGEKNLSHSIDFLSLKKKQNVRFYQKSAPCSACTSLTFRIKGGSIPIQIIFFHVMSMKNFWAGSYDWVIIMPKHTEDKEEMNVNISAEFAMSRIELPVEMISSHKTQRQQIPSLFHRLFFSAHQKKATVRRIIPPKLVLWENATVVKNRCNLQSIEEFKLFIKGLVR